MNPRYANLNPFPIDEQVMQAIRPMKPGDCKQVALLHGKAMGKSLWAKLGLPFLAALYECLLKDTSFLGYVYQSPQATSIEGFIAGSTNSRLLYRRTARKYWSHLIIPFLLGILRSPSVLWHLVVTPVYFDRSGSSLGITAESLFCSFEPGLRGKRVSGHINKVLFDELLRQGYKQVKITTEADNPGSNRQLQSWGFTQARQFSFYGKPMVTYVLDLCGHPRLQQPERPV